MRQIFSCCQAPKNHAHPNLISSEDLKTKLYASFFFTLIVSGIVAPIAGYYLDSLTWGLSLGIGGLVVPLLYHYITKKPPDPTPLLIDFYTGSGRDVFGRTFEGILAFNDKELEDVHDFIQWLFPNRHANNAAPESSPLLTEENLSALKASETAQQRLSAAFIRMLQFFGLKYSKGQVIGNADGKAWITKDNHNYKRITRMLTFLLAMEKAGEANAFYTWLSENQERFPEAIQHWSNVIK